MGTASRGPAAPRKQHHAGVRVTAYADLLVPEIPWGYMGGARGAGRGDRQNKAHLHYMGSGQGMDPESRKARLHNCFGLQWHRTFVSRS